MRHLTPKSRPYFAYAALFSFFVNVLMLTVPLYMLQVYDRVLSSRSQETLWVLTLIALVALGLLVALEALRARLMLAASLAIEEEAAPVLVHQAFEHSAVPGGKLEGAQVRDLGAIRAYLTGPGINALFDAPWVPLYLLVIYAFHPLLGLVATLGALGLFGLAVMSERVARPHVEASHENLRKAARFVDGCARNAEVILAHGMTAQLLQRWRALNGAFVEEFVRGADKGNRLTQAGKLLRQVLQVAMLACGAWLVIDEQVTGGVMIAGTLLLARALAPVETAIASWKSLVEARRALARVHTALHDAGQVRPATALDAPHGALTLENVSYSFPGADQPMLRNVSLALARGEMLAVVGPSASGKSTLARVLTGIWTPSQGVVRLDGADLSGWSRERIGPHVGYLPQDVELFSGTVAENIARFGEALDQDVIEAARRAHAHDMILRLPKGYDTELGEGGAMLSGGQRQRIGLARALFGNPCLVVLDEPNASLDSEGEAALQLALAGLRQRGCGVIVITHRASLLSTADKMLVLQAGQAVSFGSPAQLLKPRATPPASVAAANVRQLSAQGA